MDHSQALGALTCAGCGSDFFLDDGDVRSFGAHRVAPPKHCPDCRQQRRLSHVNERHLFRSKCAVSGKPLITNIPPESPIRVCSTPYWFSEAVDNSQFGKKFDFDRPFFEQWRELQLAVLHPALVNGSSGGTNSDYANFSARNTNCYLVFNSYDCKDCYYGYGLQACVSVLDSYRSIRSERCYELSDCGDCRNSAFLKDCERCEDSFFLSGCNDCRHCLLCSNLANKEYYFLNEPVSKAEYESFRKLLDVRTSLHELKHQFDVFSKSFPQKAVRGHGSKSSLGNYLDECVNAFSCFDCHGASDARYSFQSFGESKDCADTNETGGGGLLYECSHVGNQAVYVRFSMQSFDNLFRLTYCSHCFDGCRDLFGSIGLKRKQYCILNHQYSKNEYEELLPRIVSHMESTGEWGEFFPSECAAVPYNVSAAQDYYPLTEMEAAEKKIFWRSQGASEAAAAGAEVPESVFGSSEKVSQELFSCKSCSKRFRIISQELRFLKAVGVALPELCFECRHEHRRRERLPRGLWARKCGSCEKDIFCAYPPGAVAAGFESAGSEAIVFCNDCFEAALE